MQERFVAERFTAEQPRRIPTLDGWRAVAIAAVLLSHGFILSDSSSRTLRAVSYAAGHLGALGVALFFAISGYLITTLLLEEREQRGSISLRAFYLRRAFRILPPAYLFLGVLAALRMPLERGEIPSAAFFFSNYWPDRSWYTQHFWSLSMEEHFYLVWPVLLAWMGNARALRAAWLAIAAVIVWRPWSVAHMHSSVPALERTDMRIDAFLFAAALAILLRSGHRTRVEALLTSVSFRIGATLALAAASAWMLAGSAPSIGTLAQSALLPPLLVSGVLWRGSMLHRALESAPLRWTGRISYGLYLWQQLFLIAHSAVTPGEAAVHVLPRVAAVFAAASASYCLLERPLLRRGRALSRRIHLRLRAPQVSCKDHESNAEIA